jgi:hypothetical protein
VIIEQLVQSTLVIVVYVTQNYDIQIRSDLWPSTGLQMRYKCRRKACTSVIQKAKGDTVLPHELYE